MDGITHAPSPVPRFVSDPFKPINKGIPLIRLQFRNRLQRLPEHQDQGVVKHIVLHTAAAEKIPAGFAIEHHQFCNPFRMTYSLPVIGDSLLGL